MNIKTIATALLTACICYACDSDNDNEYHSTYFYPLSSNGIETYADQTVDSVRVISYDSWSLDNNCDWCVISSPLLWSMHFVFPTSGHPPFPMSFRGR